MKKEWIEVAIEPSGRHARVRTGSSLLEAARQAGLPIETPCGGKGQCYRCVVDADGKLNQLSPAEKDARARDLIKPGQRLACQARAVGKATVRVVEGGMAGGAQIMEQGEQWTSFSLEPNVRRVILELSPPDREDQAADRERINRALVGVNASFGLPVLQDLGQRIRDYGFRFALVMINDEVVELQPAEPDRVLGIAFDIGTTTVVGYLMDLATGRELAVASALNPQSHHGFDVISRIMYGIEEIRGVETLSRLIRDLMNRLIEETCARANVSPRKVYEVSVAGNATMTHLFLGIDAHYLAVAPYVPVTTSAVTTPAHPLGLSIHPAGQVYILPGIGSFVGADTTGVIIASQFHLGTGPALAIDIGTNGEIVGRDSAGGLFALSTAAGPAFEGARISCGLRGISGAIERVGLSADKLSIGTIGKVKPVGICGSGLIDALAVMRQAGLLTENGRLVENYHRLAQGEKLPQRVVRGPAGLEFLLSKGRGRVPRLSITQKDIRELQLAKGAIAAGIKIMVEQIGVDEHDLGEVLLAGAFGNYIDKANAQTIGLLPKIPLNSIRLVGNAAGQGAKLALLSKSVRAEAEKVTRQVKVINLAQWPGFEQVFLQNMSFA